MPELDGNEAQPDYGGLALYVGMQGEAESILQSIKENYRFSYSFSTRDTRPLDSELCIVSFKPDVFHSIWLGRLSAQTTTGRTRLTFDNYVWLGDLDISELVAPINVESPLVHALMMGEGRLSPRDWREVINWIKNKRPGVASRLDELDALRMEASKPIQQSKEKIIAEQWEATGAAMDFSGFHRAKYLPPLEKKILSRGEPFVLNFEGARTLEEDIIPHEMRHVPGWEILKECKGGIVKLTRESRKGEPVHELTVINANKKDLEICLGVDLIFHHSAFDSCILVQYKRLKKVGITWGFDLNDQQLSKQLTAIEEIKKKWAAEKLWEEPHEYRMGAETFFVKFIKDEVSDSQSKSLFAGWYVPVDYLQLLKELQRTKGILGGNRLTADNVQRWFTNTEFSPLVKSAWMGTRGKATRYIKEMVNASLNGDRALVFAIAGRS